MAAAAAVKLKERGVGLARSKPVSIKLTQNPLVWARVGKIIQAEMALRDWNQAQTCEQAYRIVNPGKRNEYEAPMANSTLKKAIEGSYKRGGPYIATLQRIFIHAFRSSGYEIVLSSRGTELRK